MTKIKDNDNIKCWWRCRATGSLIHCWWEHKMAQPFWTTVWLICTKLKCSLDGKEIKPVNPKENQYWIFIRRTDAKAEAPIIFWPSDVRNCFIGKDPDAGKDWGHEEKGMIEDETVGWHHQLDGHEFEQTSGNSEGQGSLVCCSPWGCKGSDMT